MLSALWKQGFKLKDNTDTGTNEHQLAMNDFRLQHKGPLPCQALDAFQQSQGRQPNQSEMQLDKFVNETICLGCS